MMTDSRVGELPGRPFTAESRDEWRREVLGLFAKHVYGTTPDAYVTIDDRVLARVDAFRGGLEERHELIVTGPRGQHRFEVMLCLPYADRVAALLGLNFDGNDAVRYQWPIEWLLGSGFCVATAHASEIEPDRPDAAPEGIRRVMPWGAGSWGTIAAWAWGLSLIRRYLVGLDQVRTATVVVVGHSRMGKAALWAAARDERFSAVISNAAGCTGDALHRNRSGEDIAAITSKYPHWFTARYADYAGRDEMLPVDQHQLLASIAPRPAYVSAAAGDDWADPLGQFFAVVAARLLHSDLGPIGFHLRPGGRDMTPEDWMHYVAFIKTHVASGVRTSPD